MDSAKASPAEQRAQETIDTLFSQIVAQGDRDYEGEAVSQLDHSLQVAHLARQARADDETILAALLHDIGHFIPMYADMPAMIAPDGGAIGRGSHDVFGEKYLRQLGFSDKICSLVGAHVMAKRFLTATDAEYYNALTTRSKQTLRLQGGPLSQEDVLSARRDPLLEEKLNLRRWDDQAKVPGKVVEPLSDYVSMAKDSLISSWDQFTKLLLPDH